MRRSLVPGVGAIIVAAVAVAVGADWRPDAAEQAAAPQARRVEAPTFAADIAPIVYRNCVTCHRPGQAAPFALISYDDVRRHGSDIADVTADRYMPPWHAARAEGFPAFQDERHLTAAEIATFRRWVDADMPSGDLRRAPKPPVFPSGWTLGTPDLVLELPRPVDVPAEGPDLYRNVMLPIDLPDDRWITAIEYRPSARAVVHHALYFSSGAGVEVRDDEVVPGLGGLTGRGAGGGLGRGGRGGSALGAASDAWGGLGGWVPGATPRFFPDGIAQPLPKHTNLVIQLHMHPSGKAEREQGEMAIYFAKAPPKKSLVGVQVPPGFGVGMGIDIPAGEPRYTIRDAFVLPVDIEAFGARGHAHYLAKEMKMTATLPDGSTKGLLWIKDWDFSWQDSYFFDRAFALPKGTRIDTTITYDNTSGNLRNPSTPAKRVRWGRESLDEMGSMTLLVTTPTAAEGQQLREAQTQHLRQQIVQRMIRR